MRHTKLGLLGIIIILILYIFFTSTDCTTTLPSGGFLFVSKQRHHLLNVVRQLQLRGLTEYLLPQDNPKTVWKQISNLQPDQWDVLWSFRSIHFQQLPALSTKHRINHIPGSEGLVIKSSLWQTHQMLMTTTTAAAATTTTATSSSSSTTTTTTTNTGNTVPPRIPFMPRHFIIPRDVELLRAAWSESRWVSKSVNHRGVHILPSLKNIQTLPADTMISEYIEPLLVDQRKWDVGVYVAVTSLEPLTIWIYEANVLLRFCKETYPLDGNIDENTKLNAYVVNDYIPPWDLSSLKPRYGHHIPSKTDEGESSWNVLVEHLIEAKYDKTSVLNMKKNIHNSIVDLVKYVGPKMQRRVKELGGHPNTFFELWRFDFIVSETLQVFLCEANMSPNLMPKIFASGTDALMKTRLTKYLLNMIKSGGSYNDHVLEKMATYKEQRKKQRTHTRSQSQQTPMVPPSICTTNKCIGCPATNFNNCLDCYYSCFKGAPKNIQRSMKRLLFQYLGKGGFSLMVRGFEDVLDSSSVHQQSAAWLFGNGMDNDNITSTIDTSTATPLPVPVPLPTNWYVDVEEEEEEADEASKANAAGKSSRLGKQRNPARLAKWGIGLLFSMSVLWCYYAYELRKVNKKTILPIAHDLNVDRTR